MKLIKTKLLILSFISLPMVVPAQTTLSEMTRNEVTPIDSILKSSVSAWIDDMVFLLTTDIGKHGKTAHIRTNEELEAYEKYLSKTYLHNEAFMAFMCNDDDDATFAKYSTGKKRSIMPIITITFVDMTSGKTSVTKKNIRSWNKFLEKYKYDIDHIDVEKAQVYLVDEAKKKHGTDIGRYVYYTEHIYATAEYKINNGEYEMVSQQNDSFYIDRGKSYFGQNRDEEALMEKDHVVVILGDMSIKLFYK